MLPKKENFITVTADINTKCHVTMVALIGMILRVETSSSIKSNKAVKLKYFYKSVIVTVMKKTIVNKSYQVKLENHSYYPFLNSKC